MLSSGGDVDGQASRSDAIQVECAASARGKSVRAQRAARRTRCQPSICLASRTWTPHVVGLALLPQTECTANIRTGYDQPSVVDDSDSS